MAESRFEPADTPAAALRPEIDLLSVSDRTQYVDRCHRLLADRRLRFCLYYLDRVNAPLSIPHLAGLVEAALAPPEADVTERILDDAVRQLVGVHLPKLQEVGLIAVNDGYVRLVSDSAHPIQKSLSITAAVELDSDGRENWLVSAR